ncbi:MAG: class IV adenylate cyclase [Bacilli bacterium]|nr:class IV adenylate cyclase [Bacilli bacterium]
MESLGNKIQKYRIKSNLSQSKLGELLSVSDKTISSWENDRTIPDLDLLFKMANIFNISFYLLALDEYSNSNNLELEVKVKVSEWESNRILNLIKKDSIYLGKEEHSAIYYESKLRKFNKEYLRIRKENNVYVLNYKKTTDKNLCEEYETIVDNATNLALILEHIDLQIKGEINKTREKYLYKNKYEISFDEVENIGRFVEIEVKKYTSYEEEYNELFKLLNDLHIDLKSIDKKRYIDYLD